MRRLFISLLLLTLLPLKTALFAQDATESDPQIAPDEEVLEAPPTEEVLEQETVPEVTTTEEAVKTEEPASPSESETRPKFFRQLKSDSKLKNKKQGTAETEDQAVKAGIYVQQLDRYKLDNKHKVIHLKEVIEQSLRTNPDRTLIAHEEDLVSLMQDDNRDQFWLPQIKLSLVTEKQLIRTIRAGGKNANPTVKSPTGTAALEFGDYTIFNWGKDYIPYLNAKDFLKREKEKLSENGRVTKHLAIVKYFTLAAQKKLELIKKEELKQASYIYRLSRERVLLKKMSKQDYYQARSEFLYAEKEYQAAKLKSEVMDEEMALFLGEPRGTRFIAREELEYKKITQDLPSLLTLSHDSNSTIKDAEVTHENAKRSYELALKESMPLPKFSVNLGAYKETFGKNGGTTVYTTSEGNNSIELVASINATWTLLGENGFLNGRLREKSFLAREISEKKLQHSTTKVESEIRQAYDKVMSYQSQFLIAEAEAEALQKRYDITLSNFINSQTTFIHFQAALRDWTEGRIRNEEIKLAHLYEKVTLASLTGIEDLKGEVFENLGRRVDLPTKKGKL